MTTVVVAGVVVGLGVFSLGFVAVISRLLGMASAREKEAASDLALYRTYQAKNRVAIPTDSGLEADALDDRIRDLFASR
jgi:hypothetical protein